MPRVWDQFLTEQDRAHLSSRPAGRRTGAGRNPALLIVDMYRWALGDESLPLLEGAKLWSSYCGPVGWAAVPHIQQLLSAARAAQLPVMYTTSSPNSAVAHWSAHRGSPPPVVDPAARDRWQRRFDIITELAPAEGEVVLLKDGASAFWGTPLIGQLTYLGIDTLLVTGESTSGCVRATVVDGCMHRLRMQVVEECVFDRHEASHAINLFDMHQKYGDVISIDEALSYVRGVSR